MDFLVHLLYLLCAFAGIVLYLAVWGVIASYIAGLRGMNKLDAFKSGFFWGPFGTLGILFKKDALPDRHVICPHCGTAQEIGGSVKWYECWKCERKNDIST